MGLYGCEVAPVNEAVLTRFRGTIANVITFTTKMRAVDLTFAVTAEKGDLDPDVECFLREIELRVWGDTTYETWLVKAREIMTKLSITD